MFLDILKDTVLDSLKLLPFLFAAYLAIEIIEERAEEKTVAIVHRAGRWGPVLGGLLGAIPQCGFSAATSNLYAGSSPGARCWRCSSPPRTRCCPS